jgi:hypothetical protein
MMIVIIHNQLPERSKTNFSPEVLTIIAEYFNSNFEYTGKNGMILANEGLLEYLCTIPHPRSIFGIWLKGMQSK